MKKNSTRKFLRPKAVVAGRAMAVVILTACLMLVPTGTVFAQAREKTVSITRTGVPLDEILREVKKQTGARLIYSDSEIQKIPSVNVDIRNLPVGKALDVILDGVPLKYEYNGKSYIITPAARTGGTQERTHQPARMVITGQVVSQKTGAPLPGATILFERSFQGTTTDASGKFSITVPPNETEFIVSYMGYETKSIKVGEKSDIVVRMNEETSNIDQVVVTGFFNKDKNSFTGSVTTVGREDLRRYGNLNLIEAMKFVDPAFKLKEDNKMGSDPNTLPDFFIRGEGSFMGSSSVPIFIVDGFEVSVQTIFDMDLDRIETLTILKDASAAILYGSRAANGVIVIETRRPEEGKLKISYTNRTSVTAPDLTSYDLMNAAEKLEYEVKAGLYKPETSENDFERLERIKENVARGVDTYWLSQPTRTAVSHSHMVYVEGGGTNVLYGLGADYSRRNGVIKKSKRDVTGINFDLSYRVPDKVAIRNKFTYSQTDAVNSPYGSFSLYAAANPYNPVYDDEGKLIHTYPNHSTGNTKAAQYRNPLYDATLPYKDSQKSYSFMNNLSLDYYIIKGLRLQGSLNLSKGITRSDKFISPDHSSFEDTEKLSDKGSYTKREGENFTYNTKATLLYNFSQNDHVLFTALGGELDERKDSYSSYEATGFSNGNFNDIWYANVFRSGTRPSGSEQKSRMAGAYLNVNYAYGARYFIDVSVRIDGSSKFGENQRTAPFGSVGLGWNIHNERFMENIPWLTQLRLRGNVGTTGNQGFDAYVSRTIMQYSAGILYYESMGTTFINFGNPDLKWQKTNKTNLGLNLEVLDRRLTVIFDYYIEKTNSLLLPLTVTPSLGFSSYTENIGKIENKGLDIGITAVLVRNKNFDWAVSFSGSRNVNKIVRISDALRQLNEDNAKERQTTPVEQYQEGKSKNSIVVAPSLGINPTSGKELYLTRFGEITETYDPRDLIFYANADPKLQGTIQTNLMWKNISLNISLLYSVGGSMYNQTLINRVELADPRANADRRVLKERWQKPGDHSFFKDIADNSMTYASSRFVEKNNWIEIGNVSLSYHLRSPKLQRIGLSNARIGLNSGNIHRFSTTKLERGLDYPFAREFTFSLNLTF